MYVFKFTGIAKIIIGSQENGLWIQLIRKLMTEIKEQFRIGSERAYRKKE